MRIESITLNIDAYHEDPVSIETQLSRVIPGVQAALAALGFEPDSYTFNLGFTLVDDGDKVGWSRYEMYRIRMQLGQIDAALAGGAEGLAAGEDRDARRALLIGRRRELERELQDLEDKDDVTQKNPWE